MDKVQAGSMIAGIRLGSGRTIKEGKFQQEPKKGPNSYEAKAFLAVKEKNAISGVRIEYGKLPTYKRVPASPLLEFISLLTSLSNKLKYNKL